MNCLGFLKRNTFRAISFNHCIHSHKRVTTIFLPLSTIKLHFSIPFEVRHFSVVFKIRPFKEKLALSYNRTMVRQIFRPSTNISSNQTEVSTKVQTAELCFDWLGFSNVYRILFIIN